jgi:hypothetical protein
MNAIQCRALTVTALTAAGIAAAAGPACAGGIGDIASPSYGNSCANTGTHIHATGATTRGPGALTGLLGQTPLRGPLNQCGGADLPDLSVAPNADKTVSDLSKVDLTRAQIVPRIDPRIV